MNTDPDGTAIPLLSLRGRVMLHRGGAAQELVFKYRKGAALLGFLAGHPERAFRREVLADLLWPNLGAAAGRANLRGVLADLVVCLRRHGLAEVLDSPRESLALRCGGRLIIDVEWLMSARPNATGDAAAVGLLRRLSDEAQQGDWLDGTEDGASEDYVEWLIHQRRRIDLVLARTAIGGLAPPAGSEAVVGLAGERVSISAAQLVWLTLLRVEFAQGASAGPGPGLGPDADERPDEPVFDAMFPALCAEAALLDGRLLAADDIGCTFGFGIDSRATGQRWQALRCASALAALPVGQALALRMGVTSGRVLLTRAPGWRALGWRTRLVERLAQHAAGGDIVGDGSMAELATALGFIALGPQRFAGLQHQPQLHQHSLRGLGSLWAAPPALGEGAGGCFGREAVLTALSAVLDPTPEAAATRQADAALCLLGAPGAGKTRTAQEFARHWQGHSGAAYWIFASAADESRPGSGALGLVKALLVAHDGSAPGLAAAPIAEGPTPVQWQLLRSFGAVAAAALHPLALADLASAVVALLRSLAWAPPGQAPPSGSRVLLVLDDAPRLDASSAQLLLQIAATRTGIAWLLTGPTVPPFALALPGLSTLTLPPLGDAAARDLLAALPGAPGLAPEVERGRIANARGLPLFLLADVAPPSVHALHFAELCDVLLRQLGPARDAMQAAAVLGMLFSGDDLALLCGAEPASSALARATELGLVLTRGAGQTAFFHARLRGHLLEATPPARLQHHARAAALQRDAQQRHAEAGALWEQAGDVVRAGQAWLAAARQSFADNDFVTACAHASQLARLGYSTKTSAGAEAEAEADAAAGIAARVFHGRCLIARHGHSSVELGALAAALARLPLPAELEQGLGFELQFLFYLASTELTPGDRRARATELNAMARTPEQHYAGRWAMAHTLFWLGQFTASRQWFEAQRELGPLPDPAGRHLTLDLSVLARAELAWLLWFVGDTEGSLSVIDAALAAAQASGRQQDVCIAFCFRALMAWSASDVPLLADMARRAEAVAEAEGLQHWQNAARLLLLLAHAHSEQPLDLGRLARAVASVKAGHNVAASVSLCAVSEALVARAQYLPAIALIDGALGRLGPTQRPYFCLDLWRLKGMAHAALGDRVASVEALKQALSAAHEAGAHGWIRHWAGLLEALV